jgi:hypothetical protein
MLICCLRNRLVSVHILDVEAADQYAHTFAALAECRRLRELKLAGPSSAPMMVSNNEAELLMQTISLACRY